VTRVRVYRLAVAAVIAGLIGYLAVHALLTQVGQPRSPSLGAHTAPSSKTVALPASPGPAGSVDRIGVGFARTPPGAVAAAVNYLNVLERALIPGARWTWSQAIRTLTTRPLEARALAGQAASDRIKAQLAHPSPSYLGSWPLGYWLLSFTRARARVAIWTVGAMASPSGSVPATFSTTTCRLVWTGGDWKIADAEATAGPTPPAAGASVTQVLGFVGDARAFTGFGDVP